MVISLGDEDRALARALGYASVPHASMAELRWALDAFGALVVIAPVPVVVRALASTRLAPKHETPAVVALDRHRHFAVVILGAHRGANELARRVSAASGAVPVVTTSADESGAPILEELPGLAREPLDPGLQRRLNDGAALRVAPRSGLMLDGGLSSLEREGAEPAVTVSVSEDRDSPPPRIIPRTVVVGVGLAQRATADDVRTALERALAEAHLEPAAVAALATIDRRRLHPALLAQGLPLVGFSAAQLTTVRVPHPSSVVAEAVGTPSVAEAAALLLAGDGAELAYPKRANGPVTIALARRSHPLGRVVVVGLGPGAPDLLTPRARGALATASVVIGYHAYLTQAASFLGPRARLLSYAIGEEEERVEAAIAHAQRGELVALLASGDPGIYALASLAVERGAHRVPVEVVPGISASYATAARAGALLGHDHAVISLSDLLTPWHTIERRLEAAAASDLAIVLYNPRSKRRSWQLDKALAIVAQHRQPSTPVLIGRNVERDGEALVLTTLGECDTSAVDMLSLVIVGPSTSRTHAGLALTPRGYRS